MVGFVLFWLVVLVLATFAVGNVRRHTARVLRVASVPRAGTPTGEAFARELLDAADLGVVRVISADVDAYRAIEREIQLADGRFDHGSPGAWAVAALEVAHAGQHRDGSGAWQWWWVVSGHTIWAAPALLFFMAIGLVWPFPLIVLACLACIAVLAASGLFSLVVERRARHTATAALRASDLPEDDAAAAIRVLRAYSRAYVAESILDLGFLDRAVEKDRARFNEGI